MSEVGFFFLEKIFVASKNETCKVIILAIAVLNNKFRNQGGHYS